MPRVAACLAAVALFVCAAEALADTTDACIANAERSQTERKTGHLNSARAALLACSAETCPAAIRGDCARWLGEVEAATPTVVVRAVDDKGEDLPRVRVRVDGTERAEAPSGRAFPLDPGLHRFVFTTEGGATIEREVVVREGERDRAVSVSFAAPAVAEPRSIPRATFTLGGLGLAAMTTGAVFWGVGLHERGVLQDTCGPSHGCSGEAIDTARAKLVVGDVFFGVGAIATGSAIVWALALPRRKATSALAAGPLAGGGALVYRAAF